MKALLEKFRETYPDWATDTEMMKVARAALELCEETHPGWITCTWCHGLGYVHDDGYSGRCPICMGLKGKWNRREANALV